LSLRRGLMWFVGLTIFVGILVIHYTSDSETWRLLMQARYLGVALALILAALGWVFDALRIQVIAEIMEERVPFKTALSLVFLNAFDPDYIKLMNKNPIVFSLALPEPEISPVLAREKGAAVVASSQFWTTTINPIASFQVYPGIMRGALDVRARNITTAMLLEAADGFASSIDQKRLSPDNIVPPIFSDETTPRIAEAVAQTAIEEGIALNPLPKNKVYAKTWERLFGGRIV
jgi:hypothetical protein